MQKDTLISALLRLDSEAFLELNDNKRYSCYIVGGGALILLGYSTRVTHDIDVLNTDIPNEVFKLISKNLDINRNVVAHCDCFADDYYLRAKPIEIQTSKIDFYTLSIEDLVISKIVSGRDKDINDIKLDSVMNSLDYNKLDEIASEVRLGLLSERLVSEFNYRYEQYIAYTNEERIK